MASSADNQIFFFNAPSYLPTKLTPSNFSVWRTQLHSALIGHDLLGHIDGSRPQPTTEIPDPKDNTKSIPNPDFVLWYRQDQLILNAILGSCVAEIQSHISTVCSSKEAWNRLSILFANKSRSRIMSLKEKLHDNPRGNRSIAEYMQDVRATADALAIVDTRVAEDDLIMYALKGVGDEFHHVAAAVRVRDTPITFDELFDKLEDFERRLKSSETINPSLTIATANSATRHSTHNRSYIRSNNNNRSPWNTSTRNQPTSHNRSTWNFSRPNTNRAHNSSASYCNFCDIPGHSTSECRKLARFLKNNNVQPHMSQPMVNLTSLNQPNSQQWLFDSGASHHVTGDVNNLQQFSYYGGPDEINISDGTGLQISHIGNSTLVHQNNSFALDNILCAPSIKNNLISVSKFCQSNNVSLEFFPLHFVVKDLRTGAPMLRGENINDVYCIPSSINPRVNHTTKSQLMEWHQRLGHPAIPIIRAIFRSSNLQSFSLSPSNFQCNSCDSNKSHKLPFAENSLHSTKPLELIYSDVWGPTNLSIDGFQYYLLFVDHFSKYVWLYPMKKKSEVSILFPQFKLLVENSSNFLLLRFTPIMEDATNRHLMTSPLALDSSHVDPTISASPPHISPQPYPPTYLHPIPILNPPVPSSMPTPVTSPAMSPPVSIQPSTSDTDSHPSPPPIFSTPPISPTPQSSITSPPQPLLHTLRPHHARKPNPKYFNPKFVNHITAHPMPSSIEPKNFSEAMKDEKWRAAMFSLKDLGMLHQFLGVEVIHTPTGLFLSQHRHIADLLETFSMAGAKEIGVSDGASILRGRVKHISEDHAINHTKSAK
ncbi:hypothetical protein BUALT_Bualt06G0104800 [Buddleja alternifolia]|uniref:GAG-pre-integrase domain-containing protein n=1 Tax=Buddleja alternifolia TaxID=168488 RepID=A0AAV6XKX1_9LAMI|nr:hypothetical protein BUALT_Bualt06G0104800 [Buddleja alternifolia]